MATSASTTPGGGISDPIEDILGRIREVAVPTGRVEKMPVGYSVSGAFPFASNCENSQWIFLVGVVPADGDSPAASTPRGWRRSSAKSDWVCRFSEFTDPVTTIAAVGGRMN